MIEPVQMYAHVPVLFRGYAQLEQATAKLHRLDKRLHALAELKGGHPLLSASTASTWALRSPASGA